MSRSFFITFEGGEGGGKSTLISQISDILKTRGYDVVTTREPGGTALGEELRRLVLHHGPDLLIGVKAELMLFLAARAQHLEELIIPALKRGAIVLCDRFNDSTIAYQAAGRGEDAGSVKSLCSAVCGSFQPNLTLLLDVDPSIGLGRTRKRSPEAKDHIEAEKMDFHMRVRQAFISLAEQEPQRIQRLDASREQHLVLQNALAQIDKLLSGA